MRVSETADPAGTFVGSLLCASLASFDSWFMLCGGLLVPPWARARLHSGEGKGRRPCSRRRTQTSLALGVWLSGVTSNGERPMVDSASAGVDTNTGGAKTRGSKIVATTAAAAAAPEGVLAVALGVRLSSAVTRGERPRGERPAAESALAWAVRVAGAAKIRCSAVVAIMSSPKHGILPCCLNVCHCFARAVASVTATVAVTGTGLGLAPLVGAPMHATGIRRRALASAASALPASMALARCTTEGLARPALLGGVQYRGVRAGGGPSSCGSGNLPGPADIEISSRGPSWPIGNVGFGLNGGALPGRSLPVERGVSGCPSGATAWPDVAHSRRLRMVGAKPNCGSNGGGVAWLLSCCCRA